MPVQCVSLPDERQEIRTRLKPKHLCHSSETVRLLLSLLPSYAKHIRPHMMNHCVPLRVKCARPISAGGGSLRSHSGGACTHGPRPRKVPRPIRQRVPTHPAGARRRARRRRLVRPLRGDRAPRFVPGGHHGAESTVIGIREQKRAYGAATRHSHAQALTTHPPTRALFSATFIVPV